MTMAVMSRAVLGHTGRELVAPRGVAIGFALIVLSAAIRWVGSTFPEIYFTSMLLAGAVWTLAFTLFLLSLWPAFCGPRADRASA